MFLYKPIAAKPNHRFINDKPIDAARLLRRHRLLSHRSHTLYWSFYAVLAAYNLIGDDLRQLILPARLDAYAHLLTVLCALFFLFDIASTLLASASYRRGLLLWLDLTATAAMLVDVAAALTDAFDYRNKTTYAKLARAARAAILGEVLALGGFGGAFAALRARRRPRRYLRLGEDALHSAFDAPPSLGASKEALIAYNGGEERPFARSDGEGVAKRPFKLKDTTESFVRSVSLRTVVCVFVLSFTVPLFRYSTFWPKATAFESLAISGAALLENGGDFAALRARFGALIAETGNRLLYAGVYTQNGFESLDGAFAAPSELAERYRKYEIVSAERTANDGIRRFALAFDNSRDANENAILNIFRALTVVIIVIAFAAAHTKQLRAILFPLRETTALVERLSDNPLIALHGGARPTAVGFEPAFIGRLLADVSRLLVLGLGRAATRFVAAHLRRGARPPAPIRVRAVFAFVLIVNFPALSLALGKRLFAYLNQIAFVLHCAVERHGGEVNKNGGEAALLVFREESAEAALLCVVEALLGVARVRLDPPPVLAAGLHAGWAVESAIGTEHKLDFSYLAPTVNLAARVAGSTQHLGCSILLSETVAEGLSEELRALVRQVDCVVLKGASTPLRLFAFDVDFARVERVVAPVAATHSFASPSGGQRADGGLAALRQIDGFALSRARYTTRFLELWKGGMALYVAGEFEAARRALGDAAREIGGDGPAKALFAVIDGMSLAERKAWKGFRYAKEK